MLKVVPELVLQNYELGNLEGEFEAYAMFADISGFTKITEELSGHGKVGAEILTDALNTLFDPVINLIYKNGGMITTFAGDAVTAIFPGGSRDEIVEALRKISVEFAKRSNFKTPYGEFKFYLRMGLGSGRVEFKIIEVGDKAAYYFSGDAIRHAVINEERASKGKVVFDGVEDNIVFLKRSIIKPALSTQYLFYPQEIVDGYVENAFRGVVSVFINSTQKSTPSVIEYMLKSDKEIYLNKVDYGDKGYVLLVVFGAPKSRENDIERAVQFTRDIVAAFPNEVKAGMSYSVVYAGVVGNLMRSEYTVMGKGVNLAARLMQKAQNGQILVDRKLKEALPTIHFESVGRINLKGFKEAVEVYSPARRSYYFITDETDTIVGQRKQKEKIREFIKKFFEKSTRHGKILIEGNEGSGKTTLAFYTISFARKLNPSVKYAYFDFKTYSDVPPLELFRGFFRHAFDIENLEDERAVRKRIREFVGNSFRVKRDEWDGIRYIIGIGRNFIGEIENESVKDILMRGLFSLTRLLSSKSGLIIVFDGLKTTDRGVKEIVKYLCEGGIEGFLPVVVEPDEVSSTKNDLIIHPDPLRAEDIERILKVKTGRIPHSTLTEFLYSKSEGNARVVVEMTNLLLEKEMLEESGGYLTLKRGIGDLPDSIHHIFVARFDALPEDVRRFLRLAAVYGISFDINIIRKAFYKNRKINNLVMYAREKGIISEEVSGRYIFRDRLLREAIYSSLTFKYLEEVHKKIAKTIERKSIMSDNDVFLLFGHFYNAGMKRKAMLYGNKALKLAEYLTSYEKVLDIVDKLLGLYNKNSKKYVELLLKKATALYNLGRIVEATEVYDYIISRIGGGYLRAWALYKSAYLLSLEGKREEAEKRLKDAIRAGKKNKRILAMSYLNLGIIYEKNTPEKAIHYFEKAIEYAEIVNDRITQASALMNLGITYEMIGKGDEAYKLYEKAYMIYSEARYSKGIFKVYNLLATYYTKKGNMEEALKYYMKAYQYFRKLNIKTGISSVLLNMGIIFAYKGKFRKSLYYFKLAEKMFLESQQKGSLAIVYNNLADLYIKKHNYRKAYAYAKKAVDIIEETGSIYYGLISKITLAAASVSLSKLKESEELLNKIELYIKQNPRYSFLLPYKLLIEAEYLFKKGEGNRAMIVLDELKKTADDIDILLKADFLRWKITQDEELKQILQRKLQKLLKKSDLFEYRSMLQELSS